MKISGDISSSLPFLIAPGGEGPDPRDWLAAIINGSDDAIVSKNLSGIIQSWNGGATRLFGYQPEEVIGKSVTLLIPRDRLDEEPMILSRIHAGQRVDHFETKRRRKDGSLLDISLSISPIRNEHGAIVGASKIARDITERLRAQEQQQLLIGEMQHRVKNLFALAQAIVTISAKSSSSENQAIASIQARLGSLARAHDLVLADRDGARQDYHLGLLTLIQAIIEPYSDGERISVTGDDCQVGGRSATNLALLLHEFATNAAKYGALGASDGRLVVDVSTTEDVTSIVWEEIGGTQASTEATPGFGSRLERSLAHALTASIERDWRATGLVATISLNKAALGC